MTRPATSRPGLAARWSAAEPAYRAPRLSTDVLVVAGILLALVLVALLGFRDLAAHL